MEIPKTSEGTEVAMPAWNALYQVRDFAYRMRDLKAVLPDVPSSGAGSGAALYAIDKQTWRIGPPGAARTASIPHKAVVRYSIEWDDPGPFNSQLNAHHAFINLAEILMYVPDRRARRHRSHASTICRPDWKLVAELPAGREANSFAAESYDALVDAPVEAGEFSDFAFDNRGRAFSRGRRRGGVEQGTPGRLSAAHHFV